MDRLPYYCFEHTERHASYEGRYWNSGKGICVVACVTEDVDWAAYIGADNGYREEDCLKSTAEYGSKLSENDARYFFPEIDLPYRH